CVPKFSSTMPCFWKMPACMPSVGIWFAQASICPIATLSRSCAAALLAAASERTNASVRRIMPVPPSLRWNLQEFGELFLAERRVEEFELHGIRDRAVEVRHVF